MTKNRLEKNFSKAMHGARDLWGIKLHNNLLAHQTTPADYIIINQGTAHLVECKQITLPNTLKFKRLKQMSELLSFSARAKAFSWFCFAWFTPSKKQETYYLVPAMEMHKLTLSFSKKSITHSEFQAWAIPYASSSLEEIMSKISKI